MSEKIIGRWTKMNTTILEKIMETRTKISCWIKFVVNRVVIIFEVFYESISLIAVKIGTYVYTIFILQIGRSGVGMWHIRKKSIIH